MRSYLSAAVVAVAVAVFLPTLTMAQTSTAEEDPQQPTQNPAAGLNMKTPNSIGCYSNPGKMWDMGPYVYQTNGWCQPLCVRQSAKYFALLNGTNCFCGNEEPQDDDKVDSSKCDSPCNGYGKSNCGGTNMWQVYGDEFVQGDATGSVKITIPTQTWFGHGATSSTSSSSSITKAAESSDGKAGNTVIVTISGSPVASVVHVTATAAPSGASKPAIAAGVVVGILALAATVGAIVFFIRRKKSKDLEDERRRHDAITNFVTRGAEKPSSTFSASDSRLEPSAMFQRRQSDGSIADNQDFSRRILKVTNPDDR